ncbi:hypothetical protein pEaSNUABM6_00107 [Erwinia phage pEa_SNUABM_6]|nr:hypothetical protein pEaSNUABM6_00107 [Erwinia phage pEa_SNUABM_6]
MLRVIYETRRLDDVQSKPVRHAEIVPASAVNRVASTLRGVPVNFMLCDDHRENKPYKTIPAMRSSKRRSYADLKFRLYRHYRRSAWKQLVQLVIDDFIKNLEWEEVLKEAGYRTHSFSYHWHQFKKQYDHELRWSPGTRKMMLRLEQQDWLLPYMEEDKKT